MGRERAGESEDLGGVVHALLSIGGAVSRTKSAPTLSAARGGSDRSRSRRGSVTSGRLSEDLDWWRAHRDAADNDPAVLRELLERLKAWKAQHDQDRSGQPGPFLKMAWDAVFGDEDTRVAEAIRQIEEALEA